MKRIYFCIDIVIMTIIDVVVDIQLLVENINFLTKVFFCLMEIKKKHNI